MLGPTVKSLSSRKIAFTTAFIALCVLTVLVVPLARSWVLEINTRAIDASKEVQAELVRVYLRHEQKQPTVGISPTDWPLPVVFFEQKSAMVCPLSSPNECDGTELLYVNDGTAPIDATDTAIPIELQTHLAILLQTRYLNSNPTLSGVTFIAQEMNSPLVGGTELNHCVPTYPVNTHILRISRAAVDSRGKAALAFIQRRYCDGSLSLMLAYFTKNGDSWQVDQVLPRRGGP